MSKKPDPKSGRVAFDDRGQPVWEWRIDEDVFSRDVDTKRMRQLQESAVKLLEDEPAPRPEGFDPYSATIPSGSPPKPRRTLDDMRKLSDEIKRKRGEK